MQTTTDHSQSLSQTAAQPAPALPPGYTWRAPRLEDVPEVHALEVAANRADGHSSAGALADLESEFAGDPWCDPAADWRLAITPGGQIAATARVFVDPEHDTDGRAFVFGEVHPEYRGRGLDEFILSWMEQRGSERVQARPHAAAPCLRGVCPDTRADAIALFERHGYAPIRYFYRMRRDLLQPIPESPAPEGLVLRAYTPELNRAVQAAFNESFADHWDFSPASDEEWDMFFTGRAAFRADLTYLAMDGDQVAGFSVNRVSPEENAREGIQQGWIGTLGVRRAWRGRGVASALLCASMRDFVAEGLDYAVLGVDAENLTGALRLYERLGFAVIKRMIAFAKPLS
jgi:mycothiol synthase